MISARTGVHLPDTTYGGTPIDWNYADNSKNELQQLRADNAKLRELVRESLMDYRQYAEKYGLPPYLSDVNEHLDARLRELGIEVDE